MEENGSCNSGISVSPQLLSPISSASDDQEDENVMQDDVSLIKASSSASVTIHKEFNEPHSGDDEGDEDNLLEANNPLQVVQKEEIHQSDFVISTKPAPDSSTSDSDHSAIMSTVVEHGSRVASHGKKRKTVEDYAAQHKFDLISRSIILAADDQVVRVLVCRFCYQSIGARSDRIKEHLSSKRHHTMKAKAFRAASIETGRNMTLEEFSLSQFLPEPSTSDMKWVSAAQGKGGSLSSSTAVPKSGVKRSAPGAPAGGSSNMDMDTAQASSSSSSSNVMEEDQLLRIKWGLHSTNLLAMFKTLRFNSELIDVYLWCEGKIIKCHKLVLAAGSTYFENLFKELNQPNPVIFLKDMPFWAVTALVEFIYDGEVRLPQSRIPIFIHAAESLKIKGLTSDSTVEDHSTSVGSSGVEPSSSIRRRSAETHSDGSNNPKRALLPHVPAIAVVHATTNTNNNAGNNGIDIQNHNLHNQGQGQHLGEMTYGANYVNPNYPNYESGSAGGHYGDLLTYAGYGHPIRNHLPSWYHQPNSHQAFLHPNYRMEINSNVGNRTSYSAPQTPTEVLPAGYPAAYVQVQMSLGGNHTVPTGTPSVPYNNNNNAPEGDEEYFDPEESEQELDEDVEDEEDEEEELPQSSQPGLVNGTPATAAVNENFEIINPQLPQKGYYTVNGSGLIKSNINGANRVGDPSSSNELPSQSQPISEMVELQPQNDTDEDIDDEGDEDTVMH